MTNKVRRRNDLIPVAYYNETRDAESAFSVNRTESETGNGFNPAAHKRIKIHCNYTDVPLPANRTIR